jgi:hypothetical protein
MAAKTGVVDEHAEVAERRGGLTDSLYAFRCTEVGNQRSGVAAALRDLVGDLVQLVRPASHEQDRVAVFRKLEREGATDTARRARDNRPLLLPVHCHPLRLEPRWVVPTLDR